MLEVIFKVRETNFKVPKAIFKLLKSISKVLKSIVKVLKVEVTKIPSVPFVSQVIYHAAHHADARHSRWGPLRIVNKLCTTWRHGFRRDLTRFRTRNFAAARKIFENFGWKSARNRVQSHGSIQTLGIVVGDL